MTGMRPSIIACLLLLCLCTAPSIQQVARCLLSREDYLLCKYQNGRLVRASTNEYSVHHTRLRQSSSGYLECNVRAREQSIRPVTSLGTDSLRILFSPGFLLGDEYDNQLRIEYRVQCREGELAFFNVTSLDLQSAADCIDNSDNERCQDYLQIVRGNFGTTDVCGNEPSSDAVIQLEFGDYMAVFRTSEAVRGVGFQMYSVCFRPTEENLQGCFNVSEFMTGVCSSEVMEPSSTVLPTPPTATVSSSPNPPQPNPTPSVPPPNTKRSADDLYGEGVATRYADLFPELYPEHLVMSRDLAEFHHQWNNRVKRGIGNKLITRNILFNETVYYSGNTISVFGPDSQTRPLVEYDGVLVLQTFDPMGRIEYHKGEFQGNRDPHFSSAGPLKIIGRHAYYQLFVIDPRGLLPNEEEQRELVLMITALLAAIPLSEDLANHEDVNQTIGDLSAIPGIRNKRQGTQLFDVDREAILAALRNQEACNPVLRAQSRSTLEYYNSVDPAHVALLRVFDISCTLMSGNTLLTCTSESTTLPNRTMCQIDDLSPFQCEPLRGVVTLPSTPMTSVTITAINCLGQRADLGLRVAQLSP